VIASEAHALKGGVGTFFATNVVVTLQRLETMGQEQDLTDAQETLATAENELKVFRQALGEML
jgi:HPt (histidine-containing phosphotransfer) domain-containing protein